MDFENTVERSHLNDTEVKTLFVSGLPLDCKPRELNLLFRHYHGFENSLLKMVTRQLIPPNCPVGFVTFSSRADAEVARKELQGVRFDADLPQTLRLEYAKTNTKVSKPKTAIPLPAFSPQFLPLNSAHFPTTAIIQDQFAEQWHPNLPAIIVDPQSSFVQPLQPQFVPALYHPPPTPVLGSPSHSNNLLFSAPSYAPPSHLHSPSPVQGHNASNMACSRGAGVAGGPTTLFLATNLSSGCHEQEIKEIFTRVQTVTSPHNEASSIVLGISSGSAHRPSNTTTS